MTIRSSNWADISATDSLDQLRRILQLIRLYREQHFDYPTALELLALLIAQER